MFKPKTDLIIIICKNLSYFHFLKSMDSNHMLHSSSYVLGIVQLHHPRMTRSLHLYWGPPLEWGPGVSICTHVLILRGLHSLHQRSSLIRGSQAVETVGALVGDVIIRGDSMIEQSITASA